MFRHASSVRFALAPLLSLVGITPAYAHHGRDFLLARTAELPHPGQIFLIPRQDVLKDDRGTGIELEPALIAGAAERLAIEAHSHVEREPGLGWNYESTAAAVHLALTSPERPWVAGASLEYEISHHAETNDRVEGRFVVSRSTDAMKLAVNLFAARGGAPPEDPDSTTLRWNYSAGVRRRLGGKMDLGAEAEGNLHDAGTHELLVGIYTEPSHRITFNVGAGTGFGHQAPNFTLRTALVLQLR